MYDIAEKEKEGWRVRGKEDKRESESVKEEGMCLKTDECRRRRE